MKFVPRSKLPGASSVTSSAEGSFDCVAVRLVNCNIAQDDNLFGGFQAN
jgi:hypothetical protein